MLMGMADESFRKVNRLREETEELMIWGFS
jgi:hypothetical protein